MDSRAQKLSRRVSTIHSQNPREIRVEIVEILRQFVPSDFGLYFKCVEPDDGDTPHFSGAVFDGDAEIKAELLPYADQPVVDTPWLPPHLDPDEIDTFIRTRTRYDDRFVRNFEISQKVFEPLEIGDQLRVVLYDGQRFLGWLGLMRRGADEYFRKDEQELLRSATASIKSAIMAAEQCETSIIEEGIFAVMTPDGNLEHASPAFARWQNSDRRAHLKRCIRQMDGGAESVDRDIYAGSRVCITRLDSAHTIRYLVNVQRAPTMTIGPAHWLTDRQREIAEYAVTGATTPQIADKLDLSPQTVKTHMKNIFRRLDINSRAELANRFAGNH